MKVNKLIAMFVSALMILGLALAAMPGIEAHAAMFDVTTTVDGGPGSLRQAIINANNNGEPDTINLPAGTYTLTVAGAGEDDAATGDLDILADLTIVGAGVATTIIDGSQLDRVFHIIGDITVEISGVTITNGHTADGTFGGQGGNGGGIYNEGTLTLDDVIVSGNTTGTGGYDEHILGGNGGDGGGICNEGMLTLTNSTVSGNHTGNGGGSGSGDGGDGGEGGGVYNTDIAMLTNSTVSGNETGDGGDSVFHDGGNGGNGGGIYNAGTATLDNSTVSGNTTGNGGSGGTGSAGSTGGNGGGGGKGGGIYNDGELTLTNSTLSGNTTGNGGIGGNGGSGAEGGGGPWPQCGHGGNGGNGGGGGNGGNGGGIYDESGTLTLTNSTLSGNTTGNGGIGGGGGSGGTHGVCAYEDQPGLRDGCTGIGGNDGNGGNGGGMYNDGGLVEFKSTIIAGNTTARAGPDCAGELTSHGCNLVGNNDDCQFAQASGDQVGTEDDPIYPLLGPLWDNGGPTETHALLFTSPAIDAVSDECGCTTIGDTPEPVDQDQRGEPRPMDGDGKDDLFCDIGAYEAPLHPFNQGYQEGLEASSKIVGGTVWLEDLSELDTADNQLSVDNNNHGWLAFWAGLAFILVIGGGVFILRRRRGY